MSFLGCIALSSISIAFLINIVQVINSFLKREDIWLFTVKLIISILLNGLWIWAILDIVKGV